eukprot:6429196-Pyramimonas_sp.AAC.1
MCPQTMFSRRANHTQEARACSHDGPIIRRKRRHILTTDQSYAGSAGMLSRRANHTQEARAYSHDGPIIRKKRGHILTTDQSCKWGVRACVNRDRECVRDNLLRAPGAASVVRPATDTWYPPTFAGTIEFSSGGVA